MNQQTALTSKTSPPKIYLTSELVAQEFISFCRWWYIEVPSWYIGFFQRTMLICDDILSFSLLLRTFFVPWHRDNSATGHAFGIVIRLLYLPLAAVIIIVTAILMIAAAAIWALLPLITILSIIRSPFIS